MVIPTQNCVKKILYSPVIGTAFPTDLWEVVKISDPRAEDAVAGPRQAVSPFNIPKHPPYGRNLYRRSLLRRDILITCSQE